MVKMGNLCNDRIKTMMDEVMSGFSFDTMDKALQNLLGQAVNA